MGKNKKAQPANQQAPSSAFRWFFGSVFNLIRKLGQSVVMWCGIAWCVHEASISIVAFAGKSTAASMALNVLANVSVVWGSSVFVSGISVSLYFVERSKHRKTRDRLTDRITELERKIDPNRTSSLLTPEGLTRKEDE
jgi:hypothetical protein